MKRAQIPVADDHSIVVSGVKSLIEPQYELAGHVADGRALIEAALEVRPDLMIVDLALASQGYDIRDAADGEAALDAVGENAPDLIVLDWHMPLMDGIETCRMLRVSSDVPVIMISGNRSSSRATALDAGAND